MNEAINHFNKEKGANLENNDPIILNAEFQLELEKRLSTSLTEHLKEQKQVLTDTQFFLKKDLEEIAEKSLRSTLHFAKKELNEELSKHVSDVAFKMKKESEHHCSHMQGYSKHMEKLLFLNMLTLILSTTILLVMFYYA